MTNSASETIYCEEIKKRLAFDEPCCSSCHSDDDEGFARLCGVSFPDGTEGEGCCAVIQKAADRIKSQAQQVGDKDV